MCKRLLPVFVAAAFVLAASQTSQATPSLRLSDGTNAVTITDDDLLSLWLGTGVGNGADLSDMPGAVVFVGSVGDWSVDFTFGLSQGSAAAPFLSIGSMIASSTNGGTLTVSFSEDFFNAGSTTVLSTIGGVVSGDTTATLTYNTYADGSNSLFGTSSLLTSQTFGSGAFNGSLSAGALFAGPFSLTQEVVIFHETGGASSFQAEVQAAPIVNVPEGGATLAVFGLGLIGMAWMRRRMSVGEVDGV